MKTKSVKGPMSIPRTKPRPSPWLIRRARESGLLGMNRATAAGNPEKSTVAPPSTPAQASRPLTTAVPNEGLASHRIRMTAMTNMANQAV
jgi:hypothetical protein